jgi:hypothetical protein
MVGFGVSWTKRDHEAVVVCIVKRIMSDGIIIYVCTVVTLLCLLISRAFPAMEMAARPFIPDLCTIRAKNPSLLTQTELLFQRIILLVDSTELCFCLLTTSQLVDGLLHLVGKGKRPQQERGNVQSLGSHFLRDCRRIRIVFIGKNETYTTRERNSVAAPQRTQ